MKKMLGKGGFTLVEIMIVVAIIGLLAAVAIPNFMKARTTAQMNACKANLKQIDGAKTLRALDGLADPAAVSDLVSDYIKREPHCPTAPNDAYVVGDYTAAPTCPNVATYPDHTID
ncbi:MAG: prepilin-type N-terminal cleavage/methylation domain-containing protein [Candidatus Omnitrophica bacterium]|nr:prepilin-type N-terminal cleavage/methylation domain-containing protein [Candidatus Omnitrophota bacterium]